MIPNSHVFESLITFPNVTVLHLLLEWNKGPAVGGGRVLLLRLKLLSLTACNREEWFLV